MWDLDYAYWDTGSLSACQRMLNEGWEPFATDPPDSDGNARIWFRRRR